MNSEPCTLCSGNGCPACVNTSPPEGDGLLAREIGDKLSPNSGFESAKSEALWKVAETALRELEMSLTEDYEKALQSGVTPGQIRDGWEDPEVTAGDLAGAALSDLMENI